MRNGKREIGFYDYHNSVCIAEAEANETKLRARTRSEQLGTREAHCNNFNFISHVISFVSFFHSNVSISIRDSRQTRHFLLARITSNRLFGAVARVNAQMMSPECALCDIRNS